MSDEQEMKLPPFRSIQDFITDARFAKPNFDEPERTRNRVIQNLLYYQTNYFVVAALVMFAVCAISPRTFFYGGSAVVVAVSVSVYVKNNKERVMKLHGENALIGAIIAVILGILVIKLFFQMLIFMTVGYLALAGIFVHASYRMRNISNKFNTLRENLGLTKSPMGVILESVGLTFETPGRESKAVVFGRSIWS